STKMEIPLYNGIKYYLRQNCQKLPKNVTEEVERKILVQHQGYIIQEKEECLILYFKDKDGTLKEEIRSDELEEILEEGHKGHFGVQAAYDKLQPKYHFPHMWRTIKEYSLNKLRNTPNKSANYSFVAFLRFVLR